MSILGDVKEREKLYLFVSETVRKASAKNVLDMACADGRYAALVARENPQIQMTAADLDGTLIGNGRKENAAPNLRLVVEDARKTDFPDHSFDVIASMHTIEHLSGADQEVFLKELHRIVKPGGMLIIATPDVDVWVLQGIAGMQADHIKELTQKEFIDVVARNGFTVQSVYGQAVLTGGGKGFRKFLNFLKKLDAFRLRDMFARKLVDKIDTATHPVVLEYDVRPIAAGSEKASITVLIAKAS